MGDLRREVAGLRFSDACRELRRTEHSAFHRLRSIAHDREFVDAVQELFPELPLFANLRCGLWYHPQFSGTCYFKSTDGHYGKWAFSFSRLNLHVAFQAAHSGGLVLVDSTRKGKAFPDSLSRTVPVWAAVVNRAVAATRPVGDPAEWKALRLMTGVSASEREQIESCLDAWASTLIGSGVELPALGRPLKCLWLSRANLGGVGAGTLARLREHCTPLVLVSVSYGPDGAPPSRPGWTYVQGAGDDHQAWSLGLTPRQFWEHKAWLVDNCDEETECLRRVAEVVEGRAPAAARHVLCGHFDPGRGAPQPIGKTGLHVAAVSSFDTHLSPVIPFALVLNCATADLPEAARIPPVVQRYVHLPVPREDKHRLERCLQAALTHLSASLSQGTVCVMCGDGAAVSVAVVVAALALLYDAQYVFAPPAHIDFVSVRRAGVTKAAVRRCLTFVASHVPHACPDRNLLKQVNRFFLAAGPFGALNFVPEADGTERPQPPA
eukprot:EG_transcript_10299